MSLFQILLQRPRIRQLAALAVSLVLLATAGRAAAPHADAALARAILADSDLTVALDRAHTLLKSGFNAGSGYGEVWIRDFNTFIELALTVNDPATIRARTIASIRPVSARLPLARLT